MKKDGIFSGALILSVGAVMSKIFSAVYRIFLTRILGGEGIGLYQLIFPLYSLCVVLATAGLPMGISKVVARYKDNKHNVVKKCLLLSIIISLFLTFVLIVLGKGLAYLQGEGRLTICYMILAPSIVVISISSVLRGYFQGVKNFVPSAVSNILEQFVKLCAGLILSLILLNFSLIYAVIGAVVGIVISEIISCIILIVCYLRVKKKSEKNILISYKKLFADILPITLTNIILPISTFIDSVIVVKLLNFNFSNSVSVFLYGLESGAVSSLVSLPTIFSFAIASVMLPTITSSMSDFNKKKLIQLSSKVIIIITLPCMLFFTIAPSQILNILYNGKLDAFGLNGVYISSVLLILSGIGVVPLALNQLYSCCLHAANKRFITIKNLGIGVISKLIFETCLLPTNFFNIYALAISNTLCYFIVFVLNQIEVKRMFKISLSFDFWCKIIVCNIMAIAVVIIFLSYEYSFVNTVLVFVLAVVVYFVSIILFKLFDKNESANYKYRM